MAAGSNALPVVHLPDGAGGVMRNSPEPITVFATSCLSPTAILAEQRETLTAMLLEVRTSTALGLLQATDAAVT